MTPREQEIRARHESDTALDVQRYLVPRSSAHSALADRAELLSLLDTLRGELERAKAEGAWMLGLVLKAYNDGDADDCVVACSDIDDYHKVCAPLAQSLLDELERKTKALEFYAAEGMWVEDIAPDPGASPIPFTAPVWCDLGDKARAALTQGGEGTNV